ncbi:ribonuclease I, partial [Citrobacter sp. TBCS-14]
MTSTWRYSSLLAALLLPVSAAQADELQAKQYADFDSYVLALSWQTGF